MQGHANIQVLARLCVTDKGCPMVALDTTAPKSQQVVISDDFGGQVRLSRAQLAVFIDLARGGQLTI